GAAPEEHRPRLTDRLGRLHELLRGLDGAGPRGDHDGLGAELHRAHPDPAGRGLELSAGQLVGLEDGHHPFHTVHGHQPLGQALGLLPDDAHQGPVLALGEVGPEPQLLDPSDDGLKFRLPCVGLHYHDHTASPPDTRAPTASRWRTRSRASRKRVFSRGRPTVTRMAPGAPSWEPPRTMTPWWRRPSVTGPSGWPSQIRRKLASLGSHRSPRAARAFSRRRRSCQTSSWLRRRCSSSSRAARAATWAAWLTLNGSFTRMMAAATGADARPYPTRSPARP